MNPRYDRNVRFFGEAGQQKLRDAKVTIIGVGGIGGHVVQQTALLGVGSLALVDPEMLDDTNRNRYVTARATDPVPGTRKVDIAERQALDMDPTITVEKIYDSLVSDRAFRSITESDYVLGCVDSEGARLVLTELCAAHSRTYIDIASDIDVGNKCRYGGRICIAANGDGCLVCLNQLDIEEAQLELGGPDARRQKEAIYGVDRRELGRAGPSVVSINGVVASLAVTELMLGITGIRKMLRLITYRGEMGKVLVSQDLPRPDCYYCRGVRGQGDKADVQRYIRAGVGKFLRAGGTPPSCD